MKFNQRGSVTVFLCIVLAALIPLSCLLTDLARYNFAKKQARAALKICVESMLAAYDRQLREQYGLFSLYPRDIDSMEKELFDLLSENLNVGVSAEGATDLYGFNVRNVEVIPFYNLSEPDILEQHIAEFMKYRAPVQIVQEFYEKIKLMTGIMEEARMIEDKMEIDRLMNDIRSLLIRLHFMINDKCCYFNINPENSNETLKDYILKEIESHKEYLSVFETEANNKIEIINEARKGYTDNYDDYIAAKNKKEEAEKTLKSVIDQTEAKQKELDNINEDLKREIEKPEKDPARIASLNEKIAALEDDIEKLKERKENGQKSFDIANKEYNDIHRTITEYRNKIERNIDEYILSLESAETQVFLILNDAGRLERHIGLFISYHEDVIGILKEIIPKLDDLEDKSSRLLNKTSKNSGAVVDRIEGNLSQQLKLIHVDTYSEFLDQFENNCKALETWKRDITKFKDAVRDGKNKISNFIQTAKEIKDKPQDTGNELVTINISADIENRVNELETDLSGLKALGKMDRVFKLPEFILKPQSNEIEETEFKKWFYAKYQDQITQEIEKEINSPLPEKNDAELNSVTSDAKDLAEVIVSQEEDMSAKELNRDNLPSALGPKSSEKTLEEIAMLLEETALKYVVSEEFYENPFMEYQGLENINEKEKNFYNYEVEKATKLFELINEVVKDGLESIIESLYMNEYIVSAFKCATTRNNVLKNDIGWERPLDSTFFDKCEIEYILFGNTKETTNLKLSKTSIFAVRLALNLIHVYTDPAKLAVTLEWATLIAGWTIFGVPVVQNFLLLIWAAAESYVDMCILFRGEHVPIIKTSSTWYVSLNGLKNEALKNIKEFAQNQSEKLVDNAANAVEETLEGIIDAKIDKLFEPFEQGLKKTTGSAANSVESIGNDFKQKLTESINFENAQSFASSLEISLKNGIDSIKDRIEKLGHSQLADFRDKFKQEIKDAIFDNPLYKDMVKKIKEVGDDLIEKGFDAVSGQLESVMGTSNVSSTGSAANNIAGRLIMMDYQDYLRLMLFAVSKQNKALRTADLIQVNMAKFKDREVIISDYYTYVFVRAEVDFKPWFIPGHFFKSENETGMISVEWSQGY